jgi:hypothetical protein
VAHRRLAVEKAIVHFVEATLQGGGLRSSGRELGARVRTLVRKVTKHVHEPIAESASNTQENLSKPSAIRAEKVLVCDDDYGVVVSLAPHVIAIRVDSAEKAEPIAG